MVFSRVIRDLKHLTSVRSRPAARPRRPGSRTALETLVVTESGT